jgi:hypothetical protein
VLLDPSFSLMLADAVLVVHVGIAAFVVAGLLLVVVGNLRRWGWVNNIWFRIAHVAAIGTIVAEAWGGVVCPLTTLEMWLRSQAGAASYAGGFVEHWLQQLLYYSAPAWVFVAAYTVFALLVLVSWWYFPPRFDNRVHERSPDLSSSGRSQGGFAPSARRHVERQATARRLVS